MPKPVMPCCQPIVRSFPSGLSWSHSNFCKVAPKEKIATGTLPDRFAEELRRRHEAETAATGLDFPRPAPTEDARVLVWRRHPSGCDCPDCTYVDAHLDDADDPMPTRF